MKIFVAMDDTDNLNSRGTGKLARDTAAAIMKEFHVDGITRHQLFVHEDIPFTSHNSCAVIHVEARETDDKEWLFETAKECMLNDFVEGSDPGLAVACADEVIPPLIAFGRDAQRVVLNQEKARGIAKNLGIRLEGLGGTEDGVIGTMAGLGLAKGGNDGRYLLCGGVRDMTGPADVDSLIEAGIDAVFNIHGGEVKEGRIIIEEGKSAKPCPVDGRKILFVEDIDGKYHAVKRG
ncbi:ABC transporter substrate-binding protein [Methanoplanus endosymbiosus]|uniref:ABC transporter substrate-binding protein n=1 Tax=Methanoplanus endosymbiosus TaxID=33865 RepID=A0A9E7PK81_9EURY|nr:ABC transporter substrate-binding protein [Methanoplanus endosymbiosus]UUX91580.1 ABC transporter substrate-binding protein [Methanoplanus endosymbiosus]